MTAELDRERWRNPLTGRLEPRMHTETIRAYLAEQRPPTDSDAPPPSVFPGRKTKPTPGQLDIDGGEITEPSKTRRRRGRRRVPEL